MAAQVGTRGPQPRTSRPSPSSHALWEDRIVEVVELTRTEHAPVLATSLTRRQLIKGGLGVVAGVAAAGLPGTTAAQVASARPGRSLTPSAPPTPRALPQPEVETSLDGVLATTLRAMEGVVDLGVGHPVRTYTWNGLVPGRTWEVRGGDTLRVELVNDLPPLGTPHVMDMVRPHEWTTTNLHTHGLHVSPEGNGDNVFVSVAPGETFLYEIPIPEDHEGGIFWYHPHRHGAVCQQVRAGMAGMIVVRGAIDEVAEVAAAREQVMVLQAIELSAAFELMDPIPYPTPDQAFFPRDQILYTANGVVGPTVSMYPGEVQRWRILNAAEGKFMALELEGHQLHVLAWDGLTLRAPEPARSVLVPAGGRVEVLVRAGEPGRYGLMLSPGSSQQPNIPGLMDDPEASHTPQHGPEQAVRAVVTLEVSGEGPAMALPDTLPAYDPPMLPVVRQRTVTYTVERQADLGFLDFGVDGVPFDPERPPYRIQLDTAEEWTVVNGVDDKLADHAHGFHIHVNPFLVTHINGQPLATPQWRDTFALRGHTGDSFTFVSNFTDFTGRFVDHCHILSHEDLGMMEALEVVA